LGPHITERSITRNRIGKLSRRFAEAEDSANTQGLQALIAKYLKYAAIRYRKGMLRDVIDGVNGNVFADKMETLCGLLNGLASRREGERTFWLLLIHSLSREPLERVRRCRTCNRFFLGVRKDQKCCSLKCANAFRVRQWRKRYLQVYKMRRIQSENGNKAGRPPKKSRKGEEL
jgi:hypothetical protein